mmetsp:Transcript_678/g.1975  ORF Transcript_678/g.1975 Transcript_678/m.1975 type:complete len:219 (-) Transcript_678:284-940(-)
MAAYPAIFSNSLLLVEQPALGSMESADLKQLAAEREARAKKRTSSPKPMPNPWASSASGSSKSRTAPHSGTDLAKAHRSIRMAHSIGLLWGLLGLVFLLLLSNYWWGLCIIFAGVVLARAGGQALHSVLPAMLQEGAAPTPTEMESGLLTGLFCLQGIMAPSSSLALEWTTLLENLAFGCTYGKRNCLTGDMYAGELTLGKICGLVYGKLSSGIIRCN